MIFGKLLPRRQMLFESIKINVYNLIVMAKQKLNDADFGHAF